MSGGEGVLPTGAIPLLSSHHFLDVTLWVDYKFDHSFLTHAVSTLLTVWLHGFSVDERDMFPILEFGLAL